MKFIIPALVIAFVPLLNSQTTQKLDFESGKAPYGQASIRTEGHKVYPAFTNEEINEVQRRTERPNHKKIEQRESEQGLLQRDNIQSRRPHPTPYDRNRGDHPLLGEQSAGLGRKKDRHHGPRRQNQRYQRKPEGQYQRHRENPQWENQAQQMNPQSDSQTKKMRAHHGLGWMAWSFIISAVLLAVILLKRCARRRCQRRMRRAQEQLQQNNQQPQQINGGVNLREQIKYHLEEAKRLESILAQSEQRMREQQRIIEMQIPQTIPQVYYNNHVQHLQHPQMVNSYPQRMEKIPVGRPLVEETISEIEYPRME